MQLARLAVLAFALIACGSRPDPDRDARSKAQIGAELDDWHAAASAADEARYFDHFAPDGVFLGTDATERWSIPAFREYAHPHFAKGKAWSFRSIRRDIALHPSGAIAWFDEDLATPNLGPARGTGVVVRAGDHWKIEHYSLTITIPNDRMKTVKDLLASPAEPEKAARPSP